MTGFNSKRDMANDKDALFQKFEVAQPAQDWKMMPKKDAPLVEWAKNQTTPPQRKWVGLTNEEFVLIMEQHLPQAGIDFWERCQQFHGIIEAKLKEKNNGT